MAYQKNQEITLKITAMGNDGEGIGKLEDGYTVFVKDTFPGDEILAGLTKVKKKYAFARLIRIETPSPHRTAPRCPLARRCGGCQIQELSYEKQLSYKAEKVKNNLIHLGSIANPPMEPAIGMEDPWRYRNKAQFPVGKNKEGEIIAGFYAGRTHAIIPVEDCLLGRAYNKEILDIVLEWMKEFHVPPYEETSGTGLVRHVLIRGGFTSGELMVCLIINGEEIPASGSLVERLKQIPGMTSIQLNTNTERTNVILGPRVKTLWGSAYITDSIDGVQFRISAQSFYQVNPVQTEKLYGKALEYANLTGQETVWDVYCGIGTISLFLARKAKQVYGVEIVPRAIEDARVNASLNHMENVEFFVGKAEDVLPEQYREHHIYADVIVVDPPRKGCDPAVIDTMLKMQPERIVYVSCDSATLARDVRLLEDGGYRLQACTPVDQFCHTAHVETVCLLSKLSGAKNTIDVKVYMDELDVTSAETKATYEEIKAYVMEQTGLQVSNLYIAQVKRECGIIERENYNKAKSEDSKQPKCPDEKKKAIKEALIYFGMI